MVFSAQPFLTVFLPAVVVLYLLSPKAWRNYVLLLASLAFYFVGGSIAGTLILFWVVLVSFVGGASMARNPGRRRTAVIVAMTLAPLIWWKYSVFFSELATSPLRGMGFDVEPLDPKFLPPGISFFTFQALSYLFDVRRGTAPLGRPDRYALYISMFPQLIAGPIVRFAGIREQLNDRALTVDNLSRGATRFVHGLAKKVIIADSAAAVADAAFNSTMQRSTAAAWIGIVAYTVQIYFDFSGYSDMAIGLGKMFGFDFPENFRRPYSAVSITDFWRRWHITLSSWFRDYVYIPLGGSRVSRSVEYRNLLTVFFLVALWHGAAFTFLVWGGIHGLWLILERITGWNAVVGKVPLRRATTLLVVMVAWVFFRAASLAEAMAYIGDMFTWSSPMADPALVTALTVPNTVMLLIGVATVLLPGDWFTGPRLASITDTVDRPVVRLGYLAAATPLCLVFVASSNYSPFIYFQF